jgi:hypothetical protein
VPVIGKATLAARVLVSFVIVNLELRRRPLPEAVRRLGRTGTPRPYPVGPARLGRIVYRLIGDEPLRARCLVNALVLFRLLRRRDYPVELVIGLPDRPEDKDAHAWVELDGTDIGPPPGRGTHRELARYG